jgi:tetratricopeptide (TPR) repeat protein
MPRCRYCRTERKHEAPSCLNCGRSQSNNRVYTVAAGMIVMVLVGVLALATEVSQPPYEEPEASGSTALLDCLEQASFRSRGTGTHVRLVERCEAAAQESGLDEQELGAIAIFQSWGHQDRGDFDNALKVLNVALERNPQDSDVALELGYTLVLAGYSGEGLAMLRDRADAPDRDALAAKRLADALVRADRWEEASDWYKEAVERGGPEALRVSGSRVLGDTSGNGHAVHFERAAASTARSLLKALLRAL